jgi:hypothetical protein
MEVFKSHFKDIYDEVDIEHYHQAVLNYSDRKENIKRSDRGWIATARQFMLTNKAEGKLVKRQNHSSAQGALDFLKM